MFQPNQDIVQLKSAGVKGSIISQITYISQVYHFLKVLSSELDFWDIPTLTCLGLFLDMYTYIVITSIYQRLYLHCVRQSTWRNVVAYGFIQWLNNAKLAEFQDLPTICNDLSQIEIHPPQVLRNTPNFPDHSIPF